MPGGRGGPALGFAPSTWSERGRRPARGQRRLPHFWSALPNSRSAQSGQKNTTSGCSSSVR